MANRVGGFIILGIEENKNEYYLFCYKILSDDNNKLDFIKNGTHK